MSIAPVLKDVVANVSIEQLKKQNSPDGNGLLWTTDPSVELPIKVSTDVNHPASAKPFTVIEMLQNCVKENGKTVAMRVERNGKWVEWTYQSYYNDVLKFAKSLIALGYQRHEGLSIMGFNSPEWFIADLGAIFAGGIAAGIYTTNGPEAAHYVAHHCDAGVVVVENDEQLQKFLQIRDRLPKLRAIVMWEGTPDPSLKDVYGWQQFMQLGSSVADQALQERMDFQRPGHCCTLIYTSGTTGNPKAVMLSHDNLTWTASVCSTMLDFTKGERLVSYLPLSHIAAQMTDLHGPITIGGTIIFAKPDALKGSLVETLQVARPTFMMGVPRVWEKIEEKMKSVGAANTGAKKALGDWAKRVGLQGSYNALQGKPLPWGWSIANKVVFQNVKKALGMEHCRIRATGAAPITLNTLEYFMSLDMPLYELYGMSESTGPHSVSFEGSVKMGSVGRSMPGVETWIAQPDEKGQGEICMRGRHVFMGYMKNPEATQSTIDSQGWLHSGDLGKVDKEGFLKITGRIKELIITAGGENIPPVLIEDNLKAELPAISNAMLIGDKRKYLSCLITLKTEPDADGNPTHQLTAAALDLAKAVGSSATTVKEAMACDKYNKAIQEGVVRTNKLAISRAQYINKWKLLADDFSIASNELTPTMKLKRRIVNDKYSAEIESMYEGAAPEIPAKL